MFKTSESDVNFSWSKILSIAKPEKLKTCNLAMDLLKKITKTEIMLFDSKQVGYI